MNSWKHFQDFKQVGSDRGTIENSIEITVFNYLASFHSTLPKNANGFGLAIPKLRENSLFHIPNEFLEAFLKFQTASWQ